MADAVMVTGARAPVALHWAWALQRTGRRVFLADTLRHPIGAAHGLADGYLRFAAPRHHFAVFRDDVLRLCRDHGVTTIVPTCEEVFWLALFTEDLDAAGVRLFAPPQPLLAEVHDKAAFIARCSAFWPHLPRTHRLTTPEAMQPFVDGARDLVFKPVYSRFATRTVLRPSPARTATIMPTASDPWVAQEFLSGREVCAYAVIDRGKVAVLSVYHPLYRAGRGAGIYFQPTDPAPALEFVRRFAEDTAWTGQVSFDLIEGEAGIYPIECNPRATSGLHLIRDPAVLAGTLGGAQSSTLIGADAPAQAVRLAMWLYAGWENRGRLRAFLADLARAQEALVWEGGRRSTMLRQLRALAEIASLALSRGESLQEAATQDIEWNGPGPKA